MRLSSTVLRSLLLGSTAAMAAPLGANGAGTAGAGPDYRQPRRGRSGARGGNPRHRDQAREPRAGRAFLDQRADSEGYPTRQCQHDRGNQPQCRGPGRSEPRPGAKPGDRPGRVGRPDRPRPGRREGTGRCLPRRIGHFAVAVHAGLRPVRPQPRRNPARAVQGRSSARARSAAPSGTLPTSQSWASPRRWSKPT